MTRGARSSVQAVAALLLAITGCRPDLPQVAPGPPQLLARSGEALLALDLPETNHPGGEPAPDEATVRGSWERCWEEDGLEQHCIELPVSQVFYGHSLRSAPSGMELLDEQDRALRYHWDRTARPAGTTWRVRNGVLQLRPPQGEPPPPPESLRVRYPKAAAWENDLDPATSALEHSAFAMREVELDDERRHGVLLPAPARARWTVAVPPSGVLALEARLLPPAVDRGLRSDGASLEVRVSADDVTTVAATRALRDDRWKTVKVDLSAWAGRQVELELASTPGADATLDRVFVSNPTVYTPSREPAQVVLIFVDTLRRDHLGLYGYERDTSPAIDRWSSGAVVFEDARATSSWTLPAARALLTGMPQGAWGQVPSLQERLAAEGFTTAAFVANAFLTSAFDMGDGWGRYRYELLNPASDQIDRALAFLERHEDRDAMVMVQLMDPHMPYSEPGAYRERWAGEQPEGLEGKVNRRGLRDMRLSDERQQLVRDYLVGRYDQNIAYVDDQLARLLDELGDDAVVVLFSDHGEEFFEHGSIEHGHTLYDELLRVPLVLRAPGLTPARVATPVSLLDLTPTLLDLLEIPGAEALAGHSLLGLARGEPEAAEQLGARPLFFGGLLYEDEAWGVRAPDGHKWISRGGRQELYALGEDPDEQQDLARGSTPEVEGYPALLEAALGREVQPLWRIHGRGTGRIVNSFEGSLELRHPDGLVQAWHPISLTGDMAAPVIDGGVLRVETSPGKHLPREIFVQPAGDALDPTGLQLTIVSGDDRWERTRPDSATPPSPELARRQTIVSAGKGDGRFTVSLHHAPLPYPDELGVQSTGGSMDEHLKALGYLDE